MMHLCQIADRHQTGATNMKKPRDPGIARLKLYVGLA